MNECACLRLRVCLCVCLRAWFGDQPLISWMWFFVIDISHSLQNFYQRCHRRHLLVFLTSAPSTASQRTPGPSITASPMAPRHSGPAQVMNLQSNMGLGVAGFPLEEPKSETPPGPPSKFSRKAHSSGRLGRFFSYQRLTSTKFLTNLSSYT